MKSTDTWCKFKSKFLCGDLVETEFGLAIITEVSSNQFDQYSVWPLPQWKYKKEGAMLIPVKYAWYEDCELVLIEKGAASKARDLANK